MENIDFLPDRIRLQRSRRRRIIRQAFLAVVCTMGLVLLGYVRQNAVRNAQAELSSLREHGQELQRQVAMRDGLEKQQAQLQIARRVDDQLGSRINALEVLAELSKMVPSNMTLISLNFETIEQKVPIDMNAGGKPSARASSAGPTKERVVKRVRLTLTGIAMNDVDVANFIAQLSANPLFEDVNMGYAKTTDFRGKSSREFQADCYVSK